MAKIVNSWNDWDPLKHVIVGRCDNSVIPPEEPATSEKVPVDSDMRGMWGLRPLRTVEVGNACLENLVKICEDNGVVVDRALDRRSRRSEKAVCKRFATGECPLS